MKNYIFISVSAALVLSGCGGGGGGGLGYGGYAATPYYAKNYSNYIKTSSFATGYKLYSGAELAAADGPRAFAHGAGDLSMPKGWAGAFASVGLIAGIIDSGVDYNIANGYEGYYSYKTPLFWPDLGSRLDGSSLVHHDYIYPLIIDDSCRKDGNDFCNHGQLVAATVLKELPNTKFVNITVKGPDATGDRVDVGASVDAASARGVRFFNRSYGAPTSATVNNAGDYLAAVAYRNAIIVSAAGNEELGGSVTQNSIPTNSPLKSGWIIALGYGDYRAVTSNGGGQTNTFYVEIDGKKHYIYPRGNTCKLHGHEDCIAAPYTLYVNNPDTKELTRVDGTSFSSPTVLSTAMAVYAKFPWMNNDNIKETLFTTVHKVQGGSSVERQHYFGVGVLNAAAAMHGPAEFRHDFIADVSPGLYVFSNNIAGSGGLVKSGSGTLALTGHNTFSGEMMNTEGELWLTNYNAANVANFDRLRLKNASVGALENYGELISEGFSARDLKLYSNSTVYANIGEKMQIAGDAQLGGELAVVGVANGYKMRKEAHLEEILRANRVYGQFSSVNSKSAFLRVNDVVYNDSSVQLNVEAGNELYYLPEINAYAAKNYDSLFEHFDYLAAASAQQKPYGPQSPDMTPDEMVGGFGAEAFASMMQQLSAADALALAPVLFAERVGSKTASKLAAARVVLNSLQQPNLPLVSALYASTKAAGEKRDIYASLFSYGTSVSEGIRLRAGALLGKDNQSADIAAIGASADIALGDKFSLQLDAANLWHKGELNSRALMASAALNYYDIFSDHWGYGARAAADIIALRNKGAYLAPAWVNESDITATSQSAKVFVRSERRRLNAEFSAGARMNNKYDFVYTGSVEGAPIMGGQKVLSRLSATAGADFSFELSRNAGLGFSLGSEVGNGFYNLSASLGFNYRF